MIDSYHGLGLCYGSRVMRVTGHLTDGSRGSRVTKCDQLSALLPLGLHNDKMQFIRYETGVFIEMERPPFEERY